MLLGMSELPLRAIVHEGELVQAEHGAPYTSHAGTMNPLGSLGSDRSRDELPSAQALFGDTPCF